MGARPEPQGVTSKWIFTKPFAHLLCPLRSWLRPFFMRPPITVENRLGEQFLLLGLSVLRKLSLRLEDDAVSVVVAGVLGGVCIPRSCRR